MRNTQTGLFLQMFLRYRWILSGPVVEQVELEMFQDPLDAFMDYLT
jgi:hypothetical protein